MVKRICLITPPSIFLLDERVFMTLGILKVAAVLEQAGVEVEMLDLSGVENYEEVIRDHAKTSGVTCYGLTATTPQMPAATKVYRTIRAAKSSARIILGGPHVTLIHAAYKYEQKRGVTGRAATAYRLLEEMFDVLVVGDGEMAVFDALKENPPKLVDGDDPKSDLFLTNQKLTELPFPARHLVDVNSYHYSIDGVRALSMIAQLGCLAAGTNIRLSSGREIPIEDVKVGDLLLCWNEDERRFDVGPVAAAWNREADDLWKLRTSCGTILVTSEHPIWTETGWKKVADLEPGKDRIGYLLDVQSHVRSEAVSREHGALLQQSMPPAASAENVPDLSEVVHADAGVRAGSQLLLSTMPVRVDAHARQREVVARWAGGGEGAVGFDDPNEGASTKGPTGVAAADTQLRFSTLVAREWVGPSRVYNLTVCPGHSYIANGIVVHNCPFGCGFCGGRMSPFLRRIRMRTSENIVQEMVQLYKTYGVTGFMLYDDELNVNPKIVELMDLIAKAQRDLGAEFRLRGFIKAELFTDQQAEAMYKAGFRWILVGFESGHERILTNIQKKAAQADNTRAMDIAKRHHLKVKALMSVGHPGESEETVRATRDWLLAVKPADFDATVITTYPGTPYFDEAVETKPGVWTYTYSKTGDRLHSLEVDYREVAEYYKGVPGEYTSYVYTDHLNAKELVQQRDWLEADVRAKLNIPFNAGAPAVRYEHSMGQGVIPANILRSTATTGLKAV